MLTMSASGVSVVAHGVHYAIVAVGVVGLVALLAPGLLPSPGAPRDDHEARVQALRRAIDAGTLVTPGPSGVPAVRSPRPTLTTTRSTLVPLAVVSSAAAAGVHAAVGPAHFREATLFGLFFAGSALAQLVWAGAVAVRATRGLLVLGAVGNLGVLVLWAVTRTLGLPFGLLPRPEAVGPWDLACGAWELLTALTCLAVLTRGDGEAPARRLVPLAHWHRAVQGFAALSVVALVALSLSGAGA